MGWIVWVVLSGCGDGCPKGDLATYRCPDGSCQAECPSCPGDVYACEDGSCPEPGEDCATTDTSDTSV